MNVCVRGFFRYTCPRAFCGFGVLWRSSFIIFRVATILGVVG